MNKRRQKKIPNKLASLPDDPDDSEVEGDIESDEEESDVSSSSGDEDSSSSENEDIDNAANDLDWSKSTERLNLFDGIETDPELLFYLTNETCEIEYFLSIFNENIVIKIVEETNRYAAQKERNSSKTRRSSGSDNDWIELTAKELKGWIGMNIFMAIHKLPSVDLYWSSDPALRVDAIANVMTRNRFQKITSMLHLNDNNNRVPKEDPMFDKLHKVRPLVEALNRSIKDVYKPSNLAAIDESMILFKGRSSLKQYNPMKPIKRGYKVWCLADSITGFVSNFEIYAGKSENKNSNDTLGERVVLNLTKGILNTGTLVAFDNFFTSVKLVSSLHQKGIFSVGTVRANRIGLPIMMKEKSKMQRGEYVFQRKGAVTAIKWMDAKPVTLLSSAHHPTVVTAVKRKTKTGNKIDVSCPLAVSSYNKIMGAVDKFDQLKERYSIGRRSRKWWHRIFYFLIDLAIVNSYIMYKVKNGDSKKTHLDFRVNLAKQLISNTTYRKRTGRPSSFVGKKINLLQEVRKDQFGKHVLQSIESRRRCRFCSTKEKEIRTKYVCKTCDVPLCVEPCFQKFHDS
ncbi:piggyBac transposable element-derived protein 4-like [Leptopilina boulardi]|uniref:piggyBac transposable element-derived protein 4-like n=1 Tax=Leptopilina boulardi TaxID=63433 RepID=UPI0021F60222|nr:piggyBac transposable element-derived protein 4-like [Leptopilina boulardi]